MIKRCSRIAVWAVLIGPLANEATAQTEIGSRGSVLTGVTAPRDGYPDISPDGERIVFQSNRTGTWQLWLVNIDGTGLLRLTHSAYNYTQPAWSADGRRLAAYRWLKDDAGEIGHIVIIDHSERNTSIGSGRRQSLIPRPWHP